MTSVDNVVMLLRTDLSTDKVPWIRLLNFGGGGGGVPA